MEQNSTAAFLANRTRFISISRLGKNMDLEILKNYGLVTFVIVSVMAGSAWVLRTVMLHFLEEIKNFHQALKDQEEERKVRDFHFTGAIDRIAASLQNFANQARDVSSQAVSLMEKNTGEHKDIMRSQSELIDIMKQRVRP